MNELKATPGVSATYKAKTASGSSIAIECADLPVPLNQLIVWCMTKPEQALYLLPEYYEARAKAEDQEEGSAKNHGLEV